jgi:putative nucleotidyltransferase with HDIG domain
MPQLTTLLISDQPARVADYREIIAKLTSCRVAGVDDVPHRPLGFVAIVCDVALDQPGTLARLRNPLLECRNAGVPVLCLLRDNSWRARVQADALGATEVLRADAGPTQLLKSLGKLAGLQPPPLETSGAPLAEAPAHRACRDLADMMSAAAQNRPINEQAVNSGTDLMVAVIAETGIRHWLDVVWKYDDATYQHCLLVSGLAAAFSLALNFSEGDRRKLTKAALVHDIGKAKIPIQILNKPGKLSADELVVMRGHPRIGHDILSRQKGWDADILDVVLHHHEYLDGSGYPDGLAGAQITDLVRLMTICDIYAALIEKRPYKAPNDLPTSLKILASMQGKLEMPLVASFSKVVAPR